MLNNHRSILLAFVVMFSVAAWAQTESKNRTPSIAVNSVYKGYHVLYEDETGALLVEKHGKRGLMSYYDKMLVPAKYEDVFQDVYADNDLFYVKKSGKWGIVDRKGHQILPFEYDYITRCTRDAPDDTTYYLAVKNGKFGKIKENGEVIIPFEYDAMTNWLAHESGHHYVYQNKKMGVVDYLGKVLVPPIFESVDYTYTPHQVIVFDGKKFGLFDIKTQSFTIPMVYDYLFEASDFPVCVQPEVEESVFVAYQNGQWLAFDTGGNRHDEYLERDIVKNEFRFQEKEYFVDGKPDITKMYCTYPQLMMCRNREVPVSDCIYEKMKTFMTNYGYPMDKINVDDYLRYRMGYDLNKPKLEDKDY